MHPILRLFFILFALLSFLVGCTSQSLDHFQEEGEGVIRSLIHELKAIHSREELLASSFRLQKLFERLASIMVAAEEFYALHPKEGKVKGGSINQELSDQLRIELNRIYRIEGGRQIIEQAEEKALYLMMEKLPQFQNPG